MARVKNKGVINESDPMQSMDWSMRSYEVSLRTHVCYTTEFPGQCTLGTLLICRP